MSIPRQAQFLISALQLAQVERGMLITVPRTFQIADPNDGSCWLFRSEDVAGHCWHTILVAVDLAPKVEEELGQSLDLKKVLKMLAVHDLGEIELRDVPWPRTKHAHHDELKAVKKQVADSQSAEDYVQLFEEFHDNQTLEAKLANAVDRIDACLVLLSTRDTKAAQSWRALRISRRKAEERWNPPEDPQRGMGNWCQFLNNFWRHCLDEIGHNPGWPV